MPALPTGTVTFLFTDIEGSTKLWEQHPEAMRVALARHDVLLRRVIEGNNGYVFKTVGDAFCAAFVTATDALAAAVQAHLLLKNEEWEETGPLRVRMGLHTGQAQERDGDYFGQTLNRVARLQGVGHGQQTLLSQATYQLVCAALPPDVTLQDMGQHRLKDLLAPEQIWQCLHPALPSEFPPLKSLDYLPTNLPRQMTSFIGRGHEMAEIMRLLPSTPLLTLLGAGGVGKTRLALQVGADVLDDYKDGVWLVELAALSDPTLVPQTVASVLGLREEAGRPVLQTIQDHVRDRQLLLLLDNCEHILNACAHTANALLTSCPHLQILATSREPLGIAGECPWRIPSLLTPAPDDLPMEEKDIVAVLMEYDACRLFVDRAVTQRQDFVLTRSNVPAVAHLCRQLDGIPLAIELAAARMRSLSVEEINNKLDNRFRLLTGGNRTALPRQQTLRALIDWSYDLLNIQEKKLLCRLSVFAGGWTLEAAETIGSGHEIDDWEVLDLLASLTDKSLVVAEAEHGHMRYHLLETVRQYAQARLAESGEGKNERERHQAFFAALAEEAVPQLAGPEGSQWLGRLEREHDNLRTALGWSNNEATLRLVGALWRFWLIRAHFTEGRKWLTDTLASAEAQVHSPARTNALFAAGALAFVQGDYGTARLLYEECIALYRELGDKHGIAGTLNNLGNVAREQGNYVEAHTLFEESRVLLQELGDIHGSAGTLGNLGNVAREQGDYGTARLLYEECLALFRELGDKHGIAGSLNNLGNVAREQGNYVEAHTLFEESRVLFQELGDKYGIAETLEAFAGLASAQEQAERVSRLWGAATALRETLHAPLPPFERTEYDQQVAQARRALGEDAFAAAWIQGQTMTLEQSIAYALEKSV